MSLWADHFEATIRSCVPLKIGRASGHPDVVFGNFQINRHVLQSVAILIYDPAVERHWNVGILIVRLHRLFVIIAFKSGRALFYGGFRPAVGMRKTLLANKRPSDRHHSARDATVWDLPESFSVLGNPKALW